jgi:hypothetical protein
MRLHFFSKLSLFLVILTLPYFLPPAKSILCPMVAWGSSYLDRDGNSGDPGRAGRNGKSSEERTIFADGSTINLDLSGEDGLDGEDGDNGDNGYCHSHYNYEDLDRDVRAGNGGNGGSGGKGGNGGNGGSLTVYYTNLADLRKIYVTAAGGQGGRGGRGGKGGYGCRCYRNTWEVKTCTGDPGTPNYKCKTRHYRCHQGSNGSKGASGSDGNQGNLGTLTLINRQEALAPVTPTISASLSELTQKTYTLSENQWKSGTGAGALLAPGSVITDTYREFVGRIEVPFQLVWNEQRSLSDFADEIAIVNLTSDKQVNVSFFGNVLIQGRKFQEQGITKFAIDRAISGQEATQLKVTGLSASGSNLQLNLVDVAGKSDLLATEFKIKYRSPKPNPRRRFDDFAAGYGTRYEGNIPATLVSRNGQNFTLAIGRLPIWYEFVQPRIPVEIELVVTRSLGDRSVSQEINWKGTISD